MKHVSASLVTALAFASFSVMGAPLPDASKLPPVSKQEGVTYAKDIQPIFKETCVRCHGAERPRAGLRLDSIEGVMKGGKDKEGKVIEVIEAGHSEKSGLVFAVSEINGKISMPPKPRAPKNAMGANGGTNAPAPTPPPMDHPWKPLTTEQVGLVRAWIDQGAK
jgi:cytochrome c551/c552